MWNFQKERERERENVKFSERDRENVECSQRYRENVNFFREEKETNTQRKRETERQCEIFTKQEKTRETSSEIKSQNAVLVGRTMEIVCHLCSALVSRGSVLMGTCQSTCQQTVACSHCIWCQKVGGQQNLSASKLHHHTLIAIHLCHHKWVPYLSLSSSLVIHLHHHK